MSEEKGRLAVGACGERKGQCTGAMLGSRQVECQEQRRRRRRREDGERGDREPDSAGLRKLPPGIWFVLDGKWEAKP